MPSFKHMVKMIWANPRLIRVRPSINRFMLQYMKKFTLLDVDGQLFLHSHLPSLNSRAFTRFVNEHLLSRPDGPSHAQIAVTNVCPQKCEYCYNKNRTGTLMDTETIRQTIRELKAKGTVWFGLTGGEPLLNEDIVEIVETAGQDSTVKLFATGYGLTKQLAADLKKAGLSSVSISLDHWTEEAHDRVRGCAGAFRTALDAIGILIETGIHTGVSTVVSKDMIRDGRLETFIRFLIDLGVHEAWLSEAKPTVAAFRKEELVITEEERRSLVALQDRYNREGEITVNYLGHFEGKEHFGCNAGNNMVYIDAFGEVSPCVFVPITFGNVGDESITTVFSRMKKHFPTEDRCFINKNYGLLDKYDKGKSPIDREDTLKLMEEVRFGPLARFPQIYYKKNRPDG